MIKELTNEEAARLRELLKNRFLQSPFNGAGFKISQYAPAYQHLADDIIRVVPGTEASVTTNRLRKLFYYTDPEVCAPDKLKKPSFGDDFIQVLFKYIGEELKPVASLPKPRQFPRKWLWRGAALLLLLAITTFVWHRLEQPPKYWTEDFTSVSVDSLKSRGWEILDYDSVVFSKQLKPGCLTLHTMRGDYWYTPPDSPIITNLLIKKINNRSAKITFKLLDFNPVQDYQQAGIILLDKEKRRNHNIRVTFGACKQCGQPRQSIEMIKREHETAYQISFPMLVWSIDTLTKPPISPLWIQVQYQNSSFRFFFHTDKEFASFHPIGSIDFDFEPYYVAVGAFRGIRDSIGELNKFDTIPAFFDHVKVEPLPE